jgi:hypothetical protein
VFSEVAAAMSLRAVVMAGATLGEAERETSITLVAVRAGGKRCP